MNLPASKPAYIVPEIPGYTVLEQLYLGSRTVVYRAMQQVQQRPVVIKVLRKEYPSFSELVQFRNQYTIAHNLAIPGIICPLSLEPTANGYALVMEDWGAVALSQYLEQLEQQTVSWVDGLEMALQLSEILHALAQHRVVHKDIKPANILIQPESKQVKLIDFSIASLLPKEVQGSQSPSTLEGTLAYLAPEQTGRMNRGIDYRSDFYALGVTLYQLLTGALPFTADDPLELIHCHLAKVAVPVHRVNAAVPEQVSLIVAKLMAKNAEDRYQSAMGLKHDLARCLNQWQETGAIAPFQLAEHDLSDRFLIPEKLYGRQAEVQTLLDAFERVAAGASELMLVAGFSGIGKTAVVNEVHKPIVRQRGYFICGKYDQFNRNIPLSAFTQALRDLMGQLLTESDAQLAHWKAQILAAVENNGQVLIEVIPELEQIIGKQPPVPELSGTAAQNRFNHLFPKFIEVFTTLEHPLVIFLDDLQWADSASLQLIKLLMQDKSYLLMLGAYRDNEVSAAHPFILTVDEIKKTGTTVNTITLLSLGFKDVNDLIADTLSCAISLTEPLTKLVMQKTQGNPFFLTQFLKALYEDGTITFNPDQRYWECDMAQVKAQQRTDDVVEFMVQQLQKLPPETQQILKLAACIGNQFDLNTLAIVSEQSLTQTATVLWKALQEGLILPTSQIYKLFQATTEPSPSISIANPRYRFLHDRVQQAAYSMIPEEQKQTTHLKIGQLLWCNTSESEWESQIFAIVSQMNHGIEWLTCSEERQKLAQLNLIAGHRAKAAIAYVTAMQYLTVGIELMHQADWQTQYELMLSLHESAAEVSYLLSDFERMESLVKIIVCHATTVLDQVKAYELRIQACIAKNELLQGLDVARSILTQLDIDLPDNPSPEDFSQGLQETQAMIAGRQPLDLLNLPEMNEAKYKAVLRILSSMFAITYNGCPAMFPLTMFKQVCLSIEYGNASFSAFAYASYGLILTAFLEDIETGYEFGQLATQLLAKLDAKDMQAKTLSVVNCFITHHKAHLRSTLPFFLEGYQYGLMTGDIEWASWCAFPYTFYLYMSGENLNTVKQEMETYSVAIAQFKQSIIYHYQAAYYQTVLNLLGEAQDCLKVQGQLYDESKMLPIHLSSSDRPAVYHLYINKVMLSYWFGAYVEGLSAVQIAEQYLDGVPGLYIVPLLYFYDSLLQLASTDPDWQKIQTNQTKLQTTANNAPMNYLHKWQLVEAECCRVKSQYSQAIEWYDLAIAGAKANSYTQEEALANELAAKFYLDWGKAKIAASYMQDAYYGYTRWGAKVKVDDLERSETSQYRLLRHYLQ
jgi:predicted ATPase